MNEKKVLFCFHNTDKYSGATRSLIDIIENLEKKSTVKIIVAFPYSTGSAVDYFKKKNIPIIILYYRELAYQISQNFLLKIVLYPLRIVRYYRMHYEIIRRKKELRNLKLDAVYTNTSTIFAGALINRYLKIPHIWHLREFREEDHGTKFFFGNGKFYHYLKYNTNQVIVISNAMREKILEQCNISDKLNVIYNDINENNINPRIDWKSYDCIKCLTTGTIEPGKGQLDAIKGVLYAKKRGVNIKLDIAGKEEGQYYSLLKKYINDLHANDVIHFLGFVKDLKEIRHNYDIAIVPSYNEAFGRVTIEGMLSQLLVIGAAAGGTKELISDGDTGILYHPGNYLELGNILFEINNNRSTIKKIGINGYNYALNFTKGRCADEIEKLIGKVVNNRCKNNENSN